MRVESRSESSSPGVVVLAVIATKAICLIKTLFYTLCANCDPIYHNIIQSALYLQ